MAKMTSCLLDRRHISVEAVIDMKDAGQNGDFRYTECREAVRPTDLADTLLRTLSTWSETQLALRATSRVMSNNSFKLRILRYLG